MGSRTMSAGLSAKRAVANGGPCTVRDHIYYRENEKWRELTKKCQITLFCRIVLTLAGPSIFLHMAGRGTGVRPPLAVSPLIDPFPPLGLGGLMCIDSRVIIGFLHYEVVVRQCGGLTKNGHQHGGDLTNALDERKTAVSNFKGTVPPLH